MGCGASVRVNLRTKKEDPKTIAEPVIQYGTYQFHKNAMFSETHNLYVVDPGPLEYMPPPHVPPTRKNEIFDLEEYKFLDKRVFDLPEEKRKGSLVKLVKYLVKPCKDDIGKVRVLFTYLASRNMEKFVMPLQPPKEHSVVWYLARLKNRKNNHAQFFSFMCRIAGVPCVVIHGYLKGSTYRIGQSVEKNKAPLYGEWNAVLVDQTWRLCNVFWSACAVGTDVGEKVERTYNVDETYFLADPEQLVYSHFPEEYMWQLTGRPLGIKSFEKRAFVKERFFELGLRLLSHPSCYITTETGDIEIDFGLDSDRVMDIKLKCLVFYSDFNDWHLQEDGRYQHDMIYNPNNQSVAIKIRFPRKGTYKVEIIGKDETNTDTNYIFDWVAVYKVRVNEIKSKYIAFPKVGDAGWGNNRAMVEHEIRPLSHTHAVIYAEGEWIEVTLSIDKDENRGIEICYKLTDLHKDLSRLSFERKGVSEEPDQYVIRFQPPKDEEAGLCIYMKVDDDVINLINYLVINSQIADANLADDIEIVRLELQAAIDDMHMAAMERAVDLCETKGYDEALRRETTIARDLIKRFKLLYVQKHDALALENPMIQDIKNMSSPKHEVHEVIKAVLLLLGNFEEETRVWTNCQEQLGLTERNSLRNRINVFDLDDLGLDIALGAKKIIDRVDIEVLSSHCPAAAVLYYWVQGNVEEKIKRNPEEAKQTVPRTHELGGPGAPMYKIHKPLGKITLALV